MNECVTFLSRGLPCRENVIKTLYGYLGYQDEILPECLFILGHKGTGKSKVITSLLKYLKHVFVAVDCIECYSLKIMLETILNVLANHELSIDNNYSSYAKCDSIVEFITGIKNISKQTGSNSYVIVFKNAERLRDLEHFVLPSFMKLRELTALNICTIMISDIMFEKFYNKTGLPEPIIIHFPQYNQEELLKILSLDYNFNKLAIVQRYSLPITNGIVDALGEEFYESYLSAFLHVFYRACRDLPELQHMASVCYVEYCKPVITGSILPNETSKLWRHIAPILKSAIETLYQRIGLQTILYNNENTNSIKSYGSSVSHTLNIDLPYYAKYLLIAAYLASYNAAKEDKRLFMQHHGKRKKRVNDLKQKAKVTDKLSTQIGPKTFTLDRLLAIFYAILDEKIGLTCNLLVQISSLVQLQMLVCIGGEASIDSSHYQCAVGLEFIQDVAKSVSFNIRKYLYDFI